MRMPAIFGNLSKSISWKIVLPIPIFATFAVLAVWLLLPSQIEQNVREDAVSAAVQTANQFKTIRGYYTRNVIAKAVANGNLKPSFNHATEENSIPLPATLIHDLSALLAEEDTSINLYSAFPFPVRGDRLLDEFQTEAWAFLEANPDENFVRQETRNGHQVVRVAVADRMVAQGCVDCHNAHPDSPKTDWNLGDVRGVLEVATVIDNQLANGISLSTDIIIASILGVIALILFSIFATKILLRPLTRIAVAMKELASGNSDIEVPAVGRKDEIGQLAETLQVFKDNSIEKARLEAEHRETAIQSDKDKQKMLADLVDGFEQNVLPIMETVMASSAQLQSTAKTMSSVVERTIDLASTAAMSADGASSNVVAVSGASEELASSIEEISRQVTQSTEIAGQATSQAEQTNQQIASLVAAADKIGKVVSLISDIADQTNLLALNATIEAARAGDAGKGFAVVASEVKNLATQTAKATEDITAQIETVQRETTSAAAAINEIAATIGSIDEIAGSVSAAVIEQGAATQEIAQSVNQAALGTQDAAAAVAGITEAATDTGQSANEVLAASNELQQQSNALKIQVEEFINRVRAA